LRQTTPIGELPPTISYWSFTFQHNRQCEGRYVRSRPSASKTRGRALIGVTGRPQHTGMVIAAILVILAIVIAIVAVIIWQRHNIAQLWTRCTSRSDKGGFQRTDDI
jgi:hypothetical protein